MDIVKKKNNLYRRSIIQAYGGLKKHIAIFEAYSSELVENERPRLRLIVSICYFMLGLEHVCRQHTRLARAELASF